MTSRHHRLGPHHDGSELYVPRATPQLGDVVPVRLRVPVDNPETAVWLRAVRDGEPRLTRARLASSDEHERWYEAELPVHNPVASYRFLLDEPGGYRWVNGRGVHDRDVPDAADFRLTVHDPAPAWMDDAVVYQVFPDRFARSGDDHGPLPDWALPADWTDEPIAAGRGVAQQLYGGDLHGVEQHLDHLERLGADTLYLTPIFPARSNHRYDASTFDAVDPLLGGDEALASLSTAVHGRGLRLMGDFTTNHTGAGHEWFARAQADRSSEEAGFYYWTESEPGYVGWLEHASLPKLNYNAPHLADRMVRGPSSVIGRWLVPPYSFDGWRIDVANMTGRYAADDFTHEVAREIRTTMRALNPDAVLVSEHFHDAAADLAVGGWHVNMNYSAFTRPAWTWLAEPGTAASFMGMPVPVPRHGGRSMVTTMREFDATVPWSVTRHQWNLLGSHDTARLRTVVGSAQMQEVAAALLFTYPGTPVLFAGDEGGVTGINGEHARVPMPWDAIARGGPAWDEGTFATYQRLIALRRSSRALRDGGLRWVVVEDDAVAFLRETSDERVLVLLARAPWAGATLPTWLTAGSPVNLFGGGDLDADLELPGDGPTAQVWRLA
jgi:alpha-glucosidase